MTAWGWDGGWVVEVSDQGDLVLIVTVRGVQHRLPFDNYAAYMLGVQLRNHAVCLGGIPYVAEPDLRRREALYWEHVTAPSMSRA
jgi:hypothetical protein